MWNEFVQSSPNRYRKDSISFVARTTISGAYYQSYITIWSLNFPVVLFSFQFSWLRSLLSLLKSLFPLCWSNERPYYMISVYRAPNKPTNMNKDELSWYPQFGNHIEAYFPTKQPFTSPQNDFSPQFRFDALLFIQYHFCSLYAIDTLHIDIISVFSLWFCVTEIWKWVIGGTRLCWSVPRKG